MNRLSKKEDRLDYDFSFICNVLFELFSNVVKAVGE